MTLVLVTAVIALILSLMGKLLADLLLTAYVPVLGTFAGLRYVLNPGVAFGVTFPPLIQWLLVAGAVALVAYGSINARTVFQKIAFGLILGGALGNILDRIPDGHVTDFVQVSTFPIFNVADSCVTVGVAVLAVESLLAAVFKRKGLQKP